MLNENATEKSILDYMRDIESDDRILNHSRRVFKNFVENMTVKDCTDLLAKMDEIINQKDNL